MRADRAFRDLVLCAAVATATLAVPLAITVFPSPIHHLLHSYDGLAQACAAALYRLGVQLPPLGALVLAGVGAIVVAGMVASLQMLVRTRSVLRDRRTVALPPALSLAARRVGIRARTVCFTDTRPVAYCAGLLRPCVWISTGAVTALLPDELEAVLLHEAYHARHRDPLRVLCSAVLQRMFFAFPMVRGLAARFALAKELDADRSVLRAQGSPAALAGALAVLAQAVLPFAPREVALGAWSASTARVDQLCGTRDELLLPPVSLRSRLITGFAVAVLLLLAVGQAARANLLPAAVVETIMPRATEIHECPLPVDGILL